MGKMGGTELILILGIALVVFGPGKLPQIGKAVGEAISQFKSQINKTSKNTNKEIIEEKKDNGK